MKKLFLFTSIILTLNISAFERTWFLEVKTCLACDWVQYSEPFRLREQCEMARGGLFIEGLTKCTEGQADKIEFIELR
jgi:hypothetical protein|tara:strand:+ start:76 stop:309 length:234 start_codon:yes stop_codon:yes gene_type:complete